MNTVFSTCNQVSREQGLGDVLPSAIKIPLYILRKVLVVWRIFRRAKLQSQEETDALLFYGQIASFLAGDSEWFHRAAKVVAITRCVFDAIKQANRFRKACSNLVDEWNDKFPKRIKVAERSPLPFRLFESCASPVKARKWRIKRARRVEKIWEITRLTGKIFIELGKLMLCLVELADGFSSDRFNRMDQNDQIFVNMYMIAKDTYKSKRAMIQMLREHQSTIYTILKPISPGFTALEIVEKMEGFAEWCDDRDDDIYDIANTALGILVRLKNEIETKGLFMVKFALLG
jgi:hypothetical protein